MLHLSQQQRLLQKLTPQQIQYLKLLQLPTLSLEQRIKTELEQNPMLEEGMDEDTEQINETTEGEIETPAEAEISQEKSKDEFTFEDYLNDESSYSPKGEYQQDEERDEFPIMSQDPLAQRLITQLQLADLTQIGMMVAEEIIGNIDEDGYLSRELSAIVQDINLTHALTLTLQQAEIVLKKIQRLDPVGIGARNLQECLIVQLEAVDADPAVKKNAAAILRSRFDDFTKKHFQQLSKILNLSLDDIKLALELIGRLNPKPGEGDISSQENYVTVDFSVTSEEDSFKIELNDKNVPPLRISKNYRDLMSRRKNNGVGTDTKLFLRQKFEAAKWFIASIHQRRETMLKVMKSIVERQRQFFETGEGLKPMIYKDIAEVIKMDISTISRVVNGKYVQNDYGVYELRYFFSEGISTRNGEDVSNKEVKQKIRLMLETEDTQKPLSDDRIAEILNEQGFNIARRTVAKYRESMKIPVARLRRKIS